MPIDTVFTTFVLEQLEQMITTVIIAAALITYARSNTRMFESITRILESNIEPRIDVELSGDRSENSLSITNNGACEIENLTVTVSVGCTRRYQAHPARQAIYTSTWNSVAVGGTIQSYTQPIVFNSLSAEGLPDGITLDPTDLVVNYSYIRRADKRKYSYKYRVGFVKQADGKQSFIRIDEPLHIVTTEANSERTAAVAPRFNQPPHSGINPASLQVAVAGPEATNFLAESTCIG